MFPTFHKPSGLVDNTRFAQKQEFFTIFQGNLILKLITREPIISAGTLDGEESTVITDTHTNRTTPFTTDITLLDIAMTERLLFVGIVQYQEFPFYLQCHYAIMEKVQIR